MSISFKLKSEQYLVLLCSGLQETINQSTFKSCRTLWASCSTSDAGVFNKTVRSRSDQRSFTEQSALYSQNLKSRWH